MLDILRAFVSKRFNNADVKNMVVDPDTDGITATVRNFPDINCGDVKDYVNEDFIKALLSKPLFHYLKRSSAILRTKQTSNPKTSADDAEWISSHYKEIFELAISIQREDLEQAIKMDDLDRLAWVLAEDAKKKP